MYPWLDLYAPYLAPLALVAAIAALIWGTMQHRQLRSLTERYTALTAGTNGGNLETVLNSHLENVQAARTQASDALAIVQRVQHDSTAFLQHLALVRYNPFSHTGGDQSFVLVLADHHGNGAIVNSLHAREGTRVYAKPLAAWESLYTLTEEEQEAISKARSQPVVFANGNGKVTEHV
ncbi:MAG: DUF4446 family protein [Anaerolineae bacterium]